MEPPVKSHRSIFSPSTSKEREENFDSYWAFTQKHNGPILESEKNLTIKRDTLERFQTDRVLSRKPLEDPQAFYRNYVRLKDNPIHLDLKTLLFTCIYKFARHEWVGISAAWDSTPNLDQAKTVQEKITRYHLCEEFCHVRLFHEMFRTFHLDQVQWIPLGRFQRLIYRVFPRLPEKLMSTPAFLTELMGIIFYQNLDQVLDTILVDEPEAKLRIRELLHEIMVDELAHIGQRRNYMGRLGTKLGKKLFPGLMRIFWSDIPEAKVLFDIPKMIKEGLAFDYNQVAPPLLARTWIPSYC